jgi:hypothetical protein
MNWMDNGWQSWKFDIIAYEGNIPGGKISFNEDMQTELVGIIKLFAERMEMTIMPIAQPTVRKYAKEFFIRAGEFNSMTPGDIYKLMDKGHVARWVCRKHNIPSTYMNQKTKRLNKISDHITDAVAVCDVAYQEYCASNPQSVRG